MQLIGRLMKSNNYGDFRVIDKLPDNKVLIKFINTGYETIVKCCHLYTGHVRDHTVGRLVYGWGINDADYQIYTEKGKCPIYVLWSHILERCFCQKYKKKQPTYIGVTVTDEWQYFSNFRKWVLDEQPNKNWERCVPDKDLLDFERNIKCYSKLTVVFIDMKINNFINSNSGSRGNCLLGVTPYGGRYRSQCNNPHTCKTEHIGIYETERAAHKAWQVKKHEYACQLADLQDDPRVADALRQRYAPDKDWTNK